MPGLLVVEDIQCRYDRTEVISGLNFSLRKGEIACLLGASGCGKSTILRAIAGFQELANGRIELNQKLLSKPGMMVAPEKRHVGMVFQDYALFPHLNVEENVAFGLHGQDKSSVQTAVKDAMTLVDLTGYNQRYPHELSGGQQQRVALARALAPKPQLLLLDEPFSNLDADLRSRLSLEIRKILKSLDITAILVTHDQQEAFAMGDNIGVINDGRIIQWDSPFNLYHEPATPYIANFIGKGCFLSGTSISNDSFDTEMGLVRGNRAYPWKKGTAVDILVRPDDILYEPESSLKAEIVQKTFSGSTTHYELRLPSGNRVEALFASHIDLYLGDTVGIRLDTEHLIAYEKVQPSQD